MNRLFSYGTLQQAEVQVATFGRRVESTPDQLTGFRIDLLAIRDPEVVKLSGKTHHPIITRTGDPRDVVDGVVLLVTDAELAQADAYEVSDYQRVLVPLASGGEAWVYIGRPAQD
ncbi:MAG: hypothetical protein OJF55_001312 [Rhodanobacteraceae bacterium]|nr:MAG: hypothetical protein OJF55_001312 [Rhodanobacteraceae bacterium]